MLYPRNSDKSLSVSLFEKPGAEYRGAPFWSLVPDGTVQYIAKRQLSTAANT